MRTPVGDAVAALDCGTNSTRLLVVAADGSTLDRRMVITRLGAGVDADRRLSPEGVERTLAVLRDYRSAMDGHGVRRARMVATSAARDAVNRDSFLAAAAAATGVEPELLDGDAEGRLSFRGATAGLPSADGPFLVVDIGGGSTELALGDAAGEMATCSVDVGCVRVSERWLRSDPPAAAELRRAEESVGRALEDAAATLGGVGRARRLIGLAGTVSTAAMLDLGLAEYRREAVHHHVLRRDRVEALLTELAGCTHEERAARRGVEPGRADVIVGGLVVLDSLLRRLDFDECLVSESDILDGIVMGLLQPGPARGRLA